jgi:formylglycine-generating enzyme required for sulfatase activity
MVFVPAGSYEVGPTNPDLDYLIDFGFSSFGEVTFTYGRLVGASHVTNAEWGAVVDGNPSSQQDQVCGNCPVHGARLTQMFDYMNRRSQQEGLAPCYEFPSCDGSTVTLDPFDGNACGQTNLRPQCDGYRLANGLEFERFSRGGRLSDYWCGRDSLCLISRDWIVDRHADVRARVIADRRAYEAEDLVFAGELFADRERAIGPQPVGTSCPNPWGIYDTHGNLSELLWPLDVYGDVDGQVNPMAAETTGRLSIRGSGFGRSGHLESFSGQLYLSGDAEHRISTGFRAVRAIWPE